MFIGDHTQFGQQATHLQQRIIPINDFHVSLADLSDKRQLHLFADVYVFGDTKNIPDNIFGCITQPPQFRNDMIRLVNVALRTEHQHLIDQQRMRLVAHLEHIVTRYGAISIGGGLHVVESLPQVTLCSENDGIQSVFLNLEIL